MKLSFRSLAELVAFRNRYGNFATTSLYLADAFCLNSLRAWVLCFFGSFLVLAANSRMRFALRLRRPASLILRWSV